MVKDAKKAEKAIDNEFNALASTFKLRTCTMMGSLCTFMVAIFSIITLCLGAPFIPSIKLSASLAVVDWLVIIVLSFITYLNQSRICSTYVFLDCIPRMFYMMFFTDHCPAWQITVFMPFIFFITLSMICCYIYHYQKKQFRQTKNSIDLYEDAPKDLITPSEPSKEPPKPTVVTQNLEDLKPINLSASSSKSTSSSINPSLFEDD